MVLNELIVSLHLNLSADDYAILVDLSKKYNCSVSEVISKMISMKEGEM